MKKPMASETYLITPSEIHAIIERGRLECRRRSLPQVDALMAAGWLFELPEIVNGWPRMETEPWQWYWRAPPKRAGRKGRRYLSTNQAFNAMNRRDAGMGKDCRED